MNKTKNYLNKKEGKRFKNRVTITIVSLILINFILPIYYYSYFNEGLEKTVSYSPFDDEETENISMGRAEITGEAIIELKTEFWNRFFALIFTTLISSFLLAVFLINFFRTRFEESIIVSELEKVKKKTEKSGGASQINNGMRKEDIKLFGES